MKASRTATGSGNNVSSGVWLPKGTTLKGIVLIFSSVVNKKKFISPVALLFRHTFYVRIIEESRFSSMVEKICSTSDGSKFGFVDV
jgi:hypothetical protein